MEIIYPSEGINAKELAEKQNLKTPEGKLALTFLLTAGNHLETAEETADLLISEFVSSDPKYSGTEVHIEERGVWQVHPENAEPLWGKEARMIVIDACGETKSDVHQSVGISIFDKQGNFLAGGVAGLEDDVAVFIEGDKVNFVDFKGGKNSVKDPLLVFAPGAPSHLKVAALGTRLEDDKIWEFFDKVAPKGVSVLQNFSGYALIRMLKGEIDVMLDLGEGQPWHQAALWGALAEKLGFPVHYNGGKIINASEIVSKETDPIFPIVISRNSQIHEKILHAIND